MTYEDFKCNPQKSVRDYHRTTEFNPWTRQGLTAEITERFLGIAQFRPVEQISVAPFSWEIQNYTDWDAWYIRTSLSDLVQIVPTKESFLEIVISPNHELWMVDYLCYYKDASEYSHVVILLKKQLLRVYLPKSISDSFVVRKNDGQTSFTSRADEFQRDIWPHLVIEILLGLNSRVSPFGLMRA